MRLCKEVTLQYRSMSGLSVNKFKVVCVTSIGADRGNILTRRN